MIRGKPAENPRKGPTEKPQRINQFRTQSRLTASASKPLVAELAERRKEAKFLKPPSLLHMLYSLQDIELEGLEEILARPASHRLTKEHGWLTKKNMDAIRDLMKRTLPKLIKEWDSGEFAAKLRAEQQEEEAELPLPNSTPTSSNTPSALPQTRGNSLSAPEMLQSIAHSTQTGTRSDHLEHFTAQIAQADEDELFGLLEDD